MVQPKMQLRFMVCTCTMLQLPAAPLNQLKMGVGRSRVAQEAPDLKGQMSVPSVGQHQTVFCFAPWGRVRSAHALGQRHARALLYAAAAASD